MPEEIRVFRVSANDKRTAGGIDRSRDWHERLLDAIDKDPHHRAVVRGRHMLKDANCQDIRRSLQNMHRATNGKRELQAVKRPESVGGLERVAAARDAGRSLICYRTSMSR